MRTLVGLVVLGVFLAFAPSALAAEPVSPPPGAVYREGDSVPFAWNLQEGERTSDIQFWVDENETYEQHLAADQTSLDVPDHGWGHWYWRVRTCPLGAGSASLFCPGGAWSPTADFYVLDLLSLAEAKTLTRKMFKRETNESLFVDFRQLRCELKTDFSAQCRFVGSSNIFKFFGGRGRVYFSANDPEDNVTNWHYRFHVVRIGALCVLHPDRNKTDCTTRQKWTG